MEKFAGEIGAEPRDIQSISKDAEILILSIPFGAIPKLPKEILNNLPKSSIVIDTSNYYPELRKEEFDNQSQKVFGFLSKSGEKLLKHLITFWLILWKI